MTPEQRQRAGQAVAERLREMGLTPTAAAHTAGLHPHTVLGVVRGEHWPTDAVQARLEKALGWHAGELQERSVAPGDGALAALTDLELAAELVRRLRRRAREVTATECRTKPVGPRRRI